MHYVRRIGNSNGDEINNRIPNENRLIYKYLTDVIITNTIAIPIRFNKSATKVTNNYTSHQINEKTKIKIRKKASRPMLCENLRLTC